MPVPYILWLPVPFWSCPEQMTGACYCKKDTLPISNAILVNKKIKQHLNKSIFSAIASKNCNATATAQRKFDVGVTCLSVTQANSINVRCLRCVRPLVQFFIQDSVQVISWIIGLNQQLSSGTWQNMVPITSHLDMTTGLFPRTTGPLVRPKLLGHIIILFEQLYSSPTVTRSHGCKLIYHLCFSTLAGLDHVGGSVAEWLACWTQAQKGPGSNRSRDAVG